MPDSCQNASYDYDYFIVPEYEGDPSDDYFNKTAELCRMFPNFLHPFNYICLLYTSREILFWTALVKTPECLNYDEKLPERNK